MRSNVIKIALKRPVDAIAFIPSNICLAMESSYEKGVREFLAKPPFSLRGLKKEELSVFVTALTHDSYSNELIQEYASKGMNIKTQSYERLEFLGDAILEFLVCERVFHNTEDSEGNMTLFKQDRVANARISKRVLDSGIGLDKVIRISKGTDLVENIRADCFEAMVAALYLTRGMDAVRRVVDEVILC